MCEVNKWNDRSELSMRPDRSMTPTNDSGGMEEICEFSFDLDELLNGIDMTSDTSVAKVVHDTSNILEEYISELSELAGEDSNSLSLCSSFVSSIDGEASSCFEGSYSAVSFVEQCSQEIMGMHLHPVERKVGNQETPTDSSYLPMNSPITDSHVCYSTPSLTLPAECITVPQAAVSTLGRDIISALPAKPPDPTASQLKASLSSLECFRSHAYFHTRYFDFSTLSPDDVIRLGRNEAAKTPEYSKYK